MFKGTPLQLIANFLFASFIIFLPTQLGKYFFFDFSYLSGVRMDYLAPAMYLTDIVALFIILFNIKVVKNLYFNNLFMIFVFGLALNSILALSFPLGIYKSLKILEIIFLFYVFKKSIFMQNVLKNNLLILTSLLLSAGVELILAVLQVVNKHAMQGIFYFLGERYFTLSTPGIAKTAMNGVEVLRGYGTFSHPNSLGGFYLLIFFFVLTSPRFFKLPVLKYSVLFVSAALIFITFSKIPIVMLLVLNIWYVIRNPEAIKCTFCRISRVVVLCVVSSLFLFTHGDPLSLVKRSELFQNALTIFTQYPLQGTGMGNYLIAQNQFPIKYSYFFLQPVHNIFLLFLSEGGIILFLLTLFIFYKYFKSYFYNQTFQYCVTVLLLTGSFDHYWLTLQQNMFLLPLLFMLL